MTSDPVVRASALRFAYARPAGFTLELDLFEVERGAHAAIIGPSGCGKTTLLRLLTGALEPDAGRIELLGERLGTLPPAARRARRLRSVGMVFQSFALLDYLSVTENILLPFRLSGSLKVNAPIRERVRTLAGDLGIAHTLRRRPKRLSQGERQRVAIARALVTEPAVIACDEPTGSLDPARASGVMDLILGEAHRIGATVVLVTHDHALLPRFGSVLDLGARAGAEA